MDDLNIEETARRIVDEAVFRGEEVIIIGEFHASELSKEIYVRVIKELKKRGKKCISLLEIKEEKNLRDYVEKHFPERYKRSYLRLLDELDALGVESYGVDINTGDDKRRAFLVRRKIKRIIEATKKKYGEDVVFVALFGASHVPEKIILTGYDDIHGRNVKVVENPAAFYVGGAYRVLVLSDFSADVCKPDKLKQFSESVREYLANNVDLIIFESDGQRHLPYTILYHAKIWKFKEN